jgi:hypothetical protein
MSMSIRAVISVLAGLGSGAIGFWVMWNVIGWVTSSYPGVGHNAWLLTGIFAPIVAVTIVVFWTLSRAVENPAAKPATGN